MENINTIVPVQVVNLVSTSGLTQETKLSVQTDHEMEHASSTPVEDNTESEMEGVVIHEPSSEEDRRNKSLEALFQVTHSELENIKQDETGTCTKIKPSKILVIQPNRSGETGSTSAAPTVIEVLTLPSGSSVEGDSLYLVDDNNTNSLGNTYQISSNVSVDNPPKILHLAENVSDTAAKTVRSFSEHEQNKILTVATSEGEQMQVARLQDTESPSGMYNTANIVFHLNPALQVGRKRKHPQKPGKYVCHYCGRGCAKPSVLQKHLRAHTGERPYPCNTCGFAFKTKSNLYKHCKSRAHAAKAGQVQNCGFSSSESLSKDQSEDSETAHHSLISDQSQSIDDAECSFEEEENTTVAKQDTAEQEPPPKVAKLSPAKDVTIQSSALQAACVTKTRVKTVKDLLAARKSESHEDKSIKQGIAQESSMSDNLTKQDTVTSSNALKMSKADSVTLASTVQRINENSVKVTIQLPKKETSLEQNHGESQLPNLSSKKVINPSEMKERINKILVSNEEIIDPTQTGKYKPKRLVRQSAIEEDEAQNKNALEKMNSSSIEKIQIEKILKPSANVKLSEAEHSVPQMTVLGAQQSLPSVSTDGNKKSTVMLLPSPASGSSEQKQIVFLIPKAKSQSLPSPSISTNSNVQILHPGNEISSQDGQVISSAKESSLHEDKAGTFQLINSVADMSPQIDKFEVATPTLSEATNTQNEMEQIVPSKTPLQILQPKSKLIQIPNKTFVPIASKTQIPETNTLAQLTDINSGNFASTSSKPDELVPILIQNYDPSQKRKRGRPKGSKNQRKSISLTSSFSSMDRSVSMSDVTSEQTSNVIMSIKEVPSSQIVEVSSPEKKQEQADQDSRASQALWKLKLKGKLLMKRSISTELSLNSQASMEDDSEDMHASKSDVALIDADEITEVNTAASVDSTVALLDDETSCITQAVVKEFACFVICPSIYTPLWPSQGSPVPLCVKTPQEATPEKMAHEAGLFCNLLITKEEKSDSCETEIEEQSSLVQIKTKLSSQYSGIDEDTSSELIDEDKTSPHMVPLLLLGHQYPVIGSDTVVSFCSVLRMQPMYVAQGSKKLSMYSNWKASMHNPNPSGLSTKTLLSTYQNMRSSKDLNSAVCNMNKEKVTVLTHSSYWNPEETVVKSDCVPDASHEEVITGSCELDSDMQIVQSEETVITTKQSPLTTPRRELPHIISHSSKRVPIFPGGYKSYDEYIYVRGRGRGKFVCEECGIRCKKPSMLKKHIRTHTDLRPYNCRYCDFSFKTKGNLTKHMKSKSHYRKCMELGLDPVPTMVEDSQINPEILNRQCSIMSDCSQSEEVVEEELHVDVEVSDDEPEQDFKNMCRLGTVYGFNSTELSPSDLQKGATKITTVKGVVPSLQTEIAKSLLDLSKQADDQTSSKDSDSGKISSDSADTSRLTNLIGALSSRTTFSKSMTSIESEVSKKLTTVKLPRAPSGRYAQKIAALQQANADDLRKELSLTLGKASFVPPLYTSPMTPTVSTDQVLSTFCTASDAVVPEPSENVVVSNSSNENEPVFVEELPMESTVDNSDVVNSEDSSSVEVKVMEVETNTETMTTSQSDQSESKKTIPSYVPGVQFVTSENKAPFEIQPIPGKVFTEKLSDGQYECSLCDKKFKKQHQLTLHKNVHFLNGKIRCEDCDITFQNMSNLMKHKKSESHLAKACLNEKNGNNSADNPRPFKCEDCSISFRLHGHLLRHFRSKTHISTLELLGKLPVGTFAELDGPTLMSIDCSDPEKVVSSIKELLKKHNSAVVSTQSNATSQKNEGGINEFSVKTIDATELHSEQFENHQNILTSNENVTVEVINQGPIVMFQPVVSKQSETSQTITYTDHTPQTDSSDESKKNKVISDQKQNDGENKDTRCDLCGSGFPDLLALKEHLVCHAELRPYVCKTCDAGFTTAASLQNHLHTHQQDLSYVCGRCGSNFNNVADVSSHVASHRDQEHNVNDNTNKQSPLSHSNQTDNQIKPASPTNVNNSN